MRKKSKYISGLGAALMIMALQPAWAAGPPPPSIFSNTLAVSMITLMLLLLIVIGILANILIGSADYKSKKNKSANTPGKSIHAGLLIPFLLLAPTLFAQDGGAATSSEEAANTIGGMTAFTFYVMATVIFLELTVIIVLLVNIKFLLRKEQETLLTEAEILVIKRNRVTWWDRFNKLRPVSQEGDLDLGHEYDGIRELNNRLPPWWLYGFYASILFAAIYLWRFHVSHTGPSSKEEYDRSVAAAEVRIKEYLKQKGESVDENTVTLLTSAEDLAAGKKIFTISCASCHKETGAGDVGPNLTDDYWIHGNSLQDVFKTIRYGINAMPQWQNQYSNKQIAQVTSYVKSLHGSNPPNPKDPQGTLQKEEESQPAPAVDSAAAEKKIVMNP